MMFRAIANPRRTTLAHLKDAEEPVDEAAEQPERGAGPSAELPAQTANPRRTTLVDAPR